MTDNKIFKQVVDEIFIEHGFSKKGGYYYLFYPDMKIAVGLQKSGYSDGYYINLGYVFTEEKKNIPLPKDVDGDVRARFSVKPEGNEDLFVVENLTIDEIRQSLRYNINELTSMVSGIDSLKELLKRKPILLYQTTYAAKKELNIKID